MINRGGTLRTARMTVSAVGRDLTQEEWQQFLAPQSYRKTCTDRP